MQNNVAFASLLVARGVDQRAIAYRVSLNPRDRDQDFRTTRDLVETKALFAYARMQDGMRFGAEAQVLIFAAEPALTARFFGYFTFRARRQGIAPGDIVYDYEVAHLLHSFIARARKPVFYDAFEQDGMDDLVGTLTIQWPKPALRSILPAMTAGITLIT